MKEIKIETMLDQPTKKAYGGITDEWLKSVLIKSSVLIVVILFFGLFGYDLAKKTPSIMFAFQHPDMVHELKLVYDQEHEKANQNILRRQRMSLEIDSSTQK